MIVTSVQLKALMALLPGPSYDASHRPRGSLDRLRKKGLVVGSKKSGWALTRKGKSYLEGVRLDEKKKTLVHVRSEVFR